MTSTKIIIPGIVKPDADLQSIKKYIPDTEIHSYSLNTVRGVGAASAIEVGESDVVVTEFEQNIRWFYSAGDFVSKAKLQQGASRGGNGELIVPVEWAENNAPSRGIISSALKMIGINVIKKVVAPEVAKSIAERIEADNPNFLYACDDKFYLSKKISAKDLEEDAKYLLLIHGTGSSTKGGFGELVTGDSNIYGKLYDKYGGRIIAYEHKTFSQSPVQNIIELVAQLPDNITLDILSHSRGGLLGEILARISSQGWKGVFTPEEMGLLQANENAKGLLGEIEILNEAVKNKKIKVELFIRVACPAAGTTLVSDRADKLLNVFFNMLSNIPGEIASTIAEGIGALLTSVLDQKNNTELLPGIECMKPDSNFIKALNYSKTQIESELVVIAGDAVGEGFINRLKMFLVDSFYKEDNDLVVNTLSMKKGTARTKNFPIFDEKAGNVDHFHYFKNRSSQRIILDAFTGNANASRGFYSSTVLERSAEADVMFSSSRSGKTIEGQPVLYVLPGIMGSNLKVKQDNIWLNYLKIAMGGLSKLQLKANDGVEADGLNGNAYKKLVDYFSSSHYVIPFAYDWRKSIFDAADKLHDDIQTTVAAKPKSVSFIVHSMGGLVFRAYALKYKDEWEALQKLGNCRVLMLGTPNAGSYTIPRILMGKDKTLNALAALDLTSNKEKLLSRFIQYKGLLELLPAKGTDDFGNAAIWNKMKNIAGRDYPSLTDDVFAGYLGMQQAAFRNFKYDADIVKYIAGRDDQTPYKIEIDEDRNKVNFYATPRGDGSVTWDSIPQELLQTSTFYINAEHGSLAKYEPAFLAYKELLETGATKNLSTSQPVTRGESKTELMPDEDLVTVPDEASLADHIMGIKVAEIKAPKQQVNISITHGDLGHAGYPLIAGHFKNDGIVEAEKVLNKKLDNYLSLRLATRNYPGDIGTHEIVLGTSNNNGAIIVGLGDFGTLTENLLIRTLRQALLSYIIKNKTDNCRGNTGNKLLGVSYLLIGSGFGGLTIYSSVRALLMAVKEANAFFETAGYNSYDLISRIEIIELYQYKAVQAGRILRSLIASSNNPFGNIVFTPPLIKKASGARNEIPDEMQTTWWHRLKIAQQEETTYNNKVVSRSIIFSSITDKARNEEKVLHTNISIVDKLIKTAASVNNHDKKLCETLYELLIPNEFKGYGSDLRNIVLLLDKETAQYPWEMLMDAYGDNDAPLVTKTGFLRQLATATYRENIELPAMNNALVVGNPKLNGYYPDLPGAAKEAEYIASLLDKYGYTVNSDYIDKEASGVLLELYSNPFKVVHIAAHGVLRDKTTGQTGVVLGEALILTPSDFKQMRKIPDLVFINCCSLGAVNKEDEERLQSKYAVAAGIGTQLIEMGVKAVIVAGWEVNDEAALNFSYVFYNELLSGSKFGDAVRSARESTYAKYSNTNTWGAYQCYGDPLYSIRPAAGGAGDKEYDFCDAVEAINKLETLISQADAATSRDDKNYINDETEKVIKAIAMHPQWKYNAAITALLAELYKYTGNAENAITYYELLFSMEDAEYTVKTVEQYCNVKVKFTAKTCKNIQDDTSKTAKEKQDAVKTANDIIEAMIQKIECLNAKPTSERLNLIASAYRRLAEVNINSRKKYLKHLAESAWYYHKAYEAYYKAFDKSYYYPLYNWLIIKEIVGAVLTPAELQPYQDAFMTYTDEEIMKMFDDADVYAKAADEEKPDFWNKAAASTKFLYQLILSGSAESIKANKEAIYADHAEAWKKEGSADKKNAISEHADFVIRMFEKFKTELKALQPIDEKIAALNELSQLLK